MQKGKYRFIVQRTQEILLTIKDEAQFQNDFSHWANLLGPERAGEVSELDYLRSRAYKLNDLQCCTSIEKEVQNEHIYIEDVHTCRHCGCTEEHACEVQIEGTTVGEPCHWVSEYLCSNPECLYQTAIEAEKEIAS